MVLGLRQKDVKANQWEIRYVVELPLGVLNSLPDVCAEGFGFLADEWPPKSKTLF